MTASTGFGGGDGVDVGCVAEGKRAFARTFRDLDVYQAALSLAVDVHGFCQTLPVEERYALASQMRRASRSVCSNLSEAWRKRRYKAAFIAKLSDSEAEAAEMQAWLDISVKLGYLTPTHFELFDQRYEQALAQLTRMIADADKWCTLDTR